MFPCFLFMSIQGVTPHSFWKPHLVTFFWTLPFFHFKKKPWVPSSSPFLKGIQRSTSKEGLGFSPLKTPPTPKQQVSLSALPHVCWLPTDQIGGEADGKMAAKTQSERWSCWNSLGINTLQDFQDLFWVGNEFNDRRTTSILIQYNFMYVHIHAIFAKIHSNIQSLKGS